MNVEPGQADRPMSATYQGASPNSSFLAGQVPGGKRDTGRIGNALSVSVATHVATGLLLLFGAIWLPAGAPVPDALKLPTEIVWLAAPGPGGGGGGGGNKSPEPPKKAEAPGQDKLTVPVAKPPKPMPEPPKQVAELQPLHDPGAAHGHRS